MDFAGGNMSGIDATVKMCKCARKVGITLLRNNNVQTVVSI